MVQRGVYRGAEGYVSWCRGVCIVVQRGLYRGAEGYVSWCRGVCIVVQRGMYREDMYVFFVIKSIQQFDNHIIRWYFRK